MSSPSQKRTLHRTGNPTNIMVGHENGLGEVMPGVQTAPAALEEDVTQLQRTPFTKEIRLFRGGEW